MDIEKLLDSGFSLSKANIISNLYNNGARGITNIDKNVSLDAIRKLADIINTKNTSTSVNRILVKIANTDETFLDKIDEFEDEKLIDISFEAYINKIDIDDLKYRYSNDNIKLYISYKKLGIDIKSLLGRGFDKAQIKKLSSLLPTYDTSKFTSKMSEKEMNLFIKCVSSGKDPFGYPEGYNEAERAVYVASLDKDIDVTKLIGKMSIRTVKFILKEFDKKFIDENSDIFKSEHLSISRIKYLIVAKENKLDVNKYNKIKDTGILGVCVQFGIKYKKEMNDILDKITDELKYHDIIFSCYRLGKKGLEDKIDLLINDLYSTKQVDMITTKILNNENYNYLLNKQFSDEQIDTLETIQNHQPEIDIEKIAYSEFNPKIMKAIATCIEYGLEVNSDNYIKKIHEENIER